jgi:hypothetical protein
MPDKGRPLPPAARRGFFVRGVVRWANMDRPRLLRRLRIAVTLLGLTASVLLIVLWVRSYFTDDVFAWRTKRGTTAIVATNGRILELSVNSNALKALDWVNWPT